MEWMLQVVDEIDDTLIAARQRCANMVSELGFVPAAVAGVAGIGAAVALGADPALLCAAAVIATFAALLRARSIA